LASLGLIGVKNRFVRPGDFFVANGETCAIVGPSGAGKTSLLRIIAGLDPHEGKVRMDGEDIQSLPPHLRAIGFVSQDLHLFPHLSLEGNLLLGMRRSRLSRAEKRRRSKKLIELLRIGHLRGRKPGTFSGGEKQRAALARVLASSPRILLLDEPFSKLDFRTARYLRDEFKRLRRELALTTVLVTHDLREARELADALWVMRSGILTASSAGSNFNLEPDHAVDSFLEVPNKLACRTLKVLDNGLVEAEWAGGTLMIPDEGVPFTHFSVGPRDIEIGLNPPQGPRINRFVGLVDHVDGGDDGVRIGVKVNGLRIGVEIPRARWRQLGLSQGRMVHGFIRLKALRPC